MNTRNQENIIQILKEYDYTVEFFEGKIRVKEKLTKPLLIISIPIILTIGLIAFIGIDSFETHEVVLIGITTTLIVGFGCLLLISAINYELTLSSERIQEKGISIKGKYNNEFDKSTFVSVGYTIMEEEVKGGIMYHGVVYIMLNLGDQQSIQEVVILSGKKKVKIEDDTLSLQKSLSNYMKVPAEEIK